MHERRRPDSLNTALSITSDKNGVDSGALDTSMVQTFAWYDDGTMATQTYDYDTGGSNPLYTSTYTYDGLGRLQRTRIQDGRPRYIHFALTSEGQILSRVMN